MSQQIPIDLTEKIMDGMTNLKESVIRIEEAVKPIASIRSDVDTLKRDTVEIASSIKSAHKRLDTHDNTFTKVPSVERVENTERRTSKLEDNQRWVVITIIGAYILQLSKLLIG